MEKECEECQAPFESFSSLQVRCPECQVIRQRMHQKKYWSDKPPSCHKYHTFCIFVCNSLTIDEMRALITSKRKQMKEKNADIKMLRTHIGILTYYYRERNELNYEYREDEIAKEEERKAILERGVEDEWIDEDE